MALVEMVMPKMGESVMEGTILKWLKQVGDPVSQDESVLEVATDKVDTEVPSPLAGVIKELLAQEGDVVQVDKPIAIIETSQGNGQPITSAAPSRQAEPVVFMENGKKAEVHAPLEEPVQSGRFYSPLVLNIARAEHIALSELETIEGTGKEGRVTKKDILAFVEARQQGHRPPQTAPAHAPAPTTPPAEAPSPAYTASVGVSLNGEEEVIEMDRMRKMIADRMVASKRISPHVTSFVEADVTGLAEWREKHKDAFKKRYGSSLTFTPIFIQALAFALRDFPLVNASVEGDKLIVKKQINIGMAVALPTGNLIVPVLKHADHYNLTGLTLKVNDLAARARDNKLQPDELTGGTYTMSNVGNFGNVMGTPIIVQPQIAIMAFGAVRKKPAVIETPQGDFIGIRQMMFLSHSYDHRVIDGALGGRFVRKVADYLEQFDVSQGI
jgi:2-oxoglutarate dehydrogenase E2 component (dihydrolipoamide succinyltransferase)